jgi:hypothetical protein
MTTENIEREQSDRELLLGLRKGLIEIHKRIVGLERKIDTLGLPGQASVISPCLVGAIEGQKTGEKTNFWPVTFIGPDDSEYPVNLFDSKIVDKCEELQQSGRGFELHLKKTADGKYWNFQRLVIDGAEFKPEKKKDSDGAASRPSTSSDSDYGAFY